MLEKRNSKYRQKIAKPSNAPIPQDYMPDFDYTEQGGGKTFEEEVQQYRGGQQPGLMRAPQRNLQSDRPQDLAALPSIQRLRKNPSQV